MGARPSSPGSSSRRLLLVAVLGGVIVIVVVVALVLALRGGDSPDFRGSSPPARLVAPPFMLANQVGEVVQGAELRGRVVLLTFLSTNCRAQCPPTASTIRVAMAELTERERGQATAIAISIDPEFDSEAAAADFLEERELTGLMQYLVGSVEELQPVWSDYAVLSSVDTGSSDNHSVPVRIFNREGVWVSSLRSGDDLTVENLVHDLREALSS